MLSAPNAYLYLARYNTHPMKLFWFKCFVVTMVTIAVTWFTSKIADLGIFKILFPETTAIAEFEFTDFAFDLTLPDGMNDKITIVNIGEHDRGAIGDLIRTLHDHRPSVMGIDVFFNCRAGDDSSSCPQLRDPAGTENLRQAIREAANVVLTALPVRSRKLLADFSITGYDSLEVSDTIYSNHARNGHAFISLEASAVNEVPSCRTFDPRITLLDGRPVNAYAVEIAMRHDSVKAKRFLDRFGERGNVPINFKGNILKYGFEDQQEFFTEARHFYALDPDDVLTNNFPPALVTGRIVLLEYLGESLIHPAREKQKFYTPLNRKKIGRTFPDMYPSVVHANIINMIITGDYLYELGDYEELTLTFIICFFHVAALLSLRRKFPYLHDLGAISLVIVIIAAMALLRLLLFTEFNIKSDLTFTIGSLALAGIIVALYHDLLDGRLLKFMSTRLKKQAAEHEVSESDR